MIYFIIKEEKILKINLHQLKRFSNKEIEKDDEIKVNNE